jgi:two-component sensor histidine kinase
MKLVHGLVHQINAMLEIKSVQGTVARILFPPRKERLK